MNRGVKQIIISRGEEGLYYRNSQEEFFMENPSRLPGRTVNATGAGDAFMAGLAYGQLEGLSTLETLYFARGAAAMALCHEKTINPNLSVEKINTIIAGDF